MTREREPTVLFGKQLDTDLRTVTGPEVRAPLRLFNRHGLIAGATGTGKTRTLQAMAEQLSAAGVPVILGDLKGDLASLGAAGTEGPASVRTRELGYRWEPRAAPVELLSLTEGRGTTVRAPVSTFGPLLLSRILETSDAQASVLAMVHAWAEDTRIPLDTLGDLTAVLRFLASSEGRDAQSAYGGMGAATLNVLLRRVLELERQGGSALFGRPGFDVSDLMRTRDGAGVVSVVDLTDVQTKPRLFSTFTLWLLSELFAQLPEVGDTDRPRLAFVFDEAHLLFDRAPSALVELVATTVRMIRSKGVAVFFVTQAPTDVPDAVLAQLGHRVQHALRAFTPKDQRALRATAETFPVGPVDIRTALQALGTGDALVSVLGPSGAPGATVPVRMVAPRSRMAPMSPAELDTLAAAGDLSGRYAPVVGPTAAGRLELFRPAVRDERADPPEDPRERARAAGRDLGRSFGRAFRR